jgi:hypothetical protein
VKGHDLKNNFTVVRTLRAHHTDESAEVANKRAVILAIDRKADSFFQAGAIQCPGTSNPAAARLVERRDDLSGVQAPQSPPRLRRQLSTIAEPSDLTELPLACLWR